MIPLDKLLNSENIILLLIAFFGAFFANVKIYLLDPQLRSNGFLDGGLTWRAGKGDAW